MYADEPNDLEILWDQLLSRRPKRVKAAFQRLGPDEQRAVLAHLVRMANEPGWHPEQRVSAQASLDALSDKEDLDG